MKKLFMLLSLLLAFAASADDQMPPQSIMDQVDALYNNGRYSECISLLKANKNYPWCLNYLGNIYYNGKVVAQDYSTAVEYYTKAANKGYALSQFYLGHCYELGTGVEKDIDLAMVWYKKASERGNARAQNYLGNLYYIRYCDNNNMDDATQSFYWEKLAAEQDVPEAQYMMGLLYSIGVGIPQDYCVALKYFKLAAEQNVALAIYQIGVLFAEGLCVPEDESIALKYFKMAEELGVTEARIWIDEIEDPDPVITPYISHPSKVGD